MKGTLNTSGAVSAKTAKFAAHAKVAMQVAQRLVEHYPVTGDAPRRPQTPAQLIEYVEWALPRARQLGTRVSPAEARSVGFMHAAHRLKTAAAEEALAKQKAETLEGLSKTESDGAVAEPDQAVGTV